MGSNPFWENKIEHKPRWTIHFVWKSGLPLETQLKAVDLHSNLEGERSLKIAAREGNSRTPSAQDAQIKGI